MVLGITHIAPITTYHQALMKKHLPLDQQFSLMDTKIQGIIDELDELLSELGCVPGELGEDLEDKGPWPGY